MLTVILRRLTWTGVRGGINGSRAAMILAILAVGVRSLRRISRTDPAVLYRTTVKAGDIIVLGAREPE